MTEPTAPSAALPDVAPTIGTGGVLSGVLDQTAARSITDRLLPGGSSSEMCRAGWRIQPSLSGVESGVGGGDAPKRVQSNIIILDT